MQSKSPMKNNFHHAHGHDYMTHYVYDDHVNGHGHKIPLAHDYDRTHENALQTPSKASRRPRPLAWLKTWSKLVLFFSCDRS